MKKIFTFLLILPLMVFSQNDAEKNKIISSYNPIDSNNLLKKIENSQIERKTRIASFLSKNSIQNEFYKEGSKYKIYDIVNGSPVFISTDNRLSALALKTNKLYPGGTLGLSLTGNGMTVGVWDGGWALAAHQEFQFNGSSRVTNPDYPGVNPTAEQHATHVVGTVSAKGVTTNARGMAYESTVKSYDWSNDEFEVSSEAGTNGLLISNHSYGIPVLADNGDMNVPSWYMGCYNTAAYDWDQIAYTYPYYLSVQSAGNSGSDAYTGGLSPGIDKLTGNKNTKNLLIVANANPTVHPITGVISSLLINPSSSQGPTDDGRIKPDIAADGTNLYSTSNESTTSYTTMSGTSMASPSIAGSVILLQQLYNNLHSSFMKAATLKGVVCHTALDDATTVGPDPYFGWGLMDTNASASLVINDNSATPTAIIDELVVAQSTTYSLNVIVNNPQLLKATICWTDVPGTAKDNQLNSTTPALVNDLDLRIIKGAEINYPWKLDLTNITSPAIKGDNIVDNVEKVEVDSASGTYTIQVSHKGTLSGGNQAYSLIISGFDQISLNNDNFTSNTIKAFPNPVNDNLFISSNMTEVQSYKIFDIQGRLVDFKSINDLKDFSIDVSPLKTGVYFVELQSNDVKSTYKIVKRSM